MAVTIKGAQIRDLSIAGAKLTDATITGGKIASNTVAEANLLTAYTQEVIKRDGSVPFTGPVDVGSHVVSNVTTPSAASDASNKQYVDDSVNNAIAGLYANMNQKAAVNVATTADITLSGLSQTLDGIAVSSDGMRVLVKDQTVGSENGIYLAHSGAWTRDSKADTGAELLGAFVVVLRGTVNKDRLYKQDTDDFTSDNLAANTNAINWTFLSVVTAVTTAPAKTDKNIPANAASSGQKAMTPALSQKPAIDGWVGVTVNGVEYNVGDTSADFYFGPTSGTAHAVADIVDGDFLWVGSGLGFALDTQDVLSVLYDVVVNTPGSFS
jgi:hypothetical protein